MARQTSGQAARNFKDRRANPPKKTSSGGIPGFPGPAKKAAPKPKSYPLGQNPYAAPATSSKAPKASKGSPSQIDATALSQYGYLSAYLKNKEIGPIIKKAASEGWDLPTLQGALFKTKWWKSTDSQARQWDATVNTDPAEAKRQITAKKVDLLNQAKTLGYGNITDKTAGSIATKALREGWTQAQITNALITDSKFDWSGKTTLSGAAGANLDQLKQLRSDYALNLSDEALTDWDKQILQGTQSTEGFTSYAKQQAANKFGWMKPALDGGQTVKQIADPYGQLAVQTLGINPSDINWADPKWSAALTNTDPKTGLSTQMTDSDWVKKLKTDNSYGYMNGQQGLNDKSAFNIAFMQKLGFQ